MLDLTVPDEDRAKIVTETRAAIQQDGELLLEQDWGARALAYQIDHREQAEYRLFQLHGPATLIASLERTLRITDGVLRHRIIKLAPGTPAAPEQSPRAVASPGSEAAAPAAPAEPPAANESVDDDALAPA
jgi:small subunit ribosomal protein S6